MRVCVRISKEKLFECGLIHGGNALSVMAALHVMEVMGECAILCLQSCTESGG